MIQVLSGLIIAGNLVAALFFLRLWRDTRDRLFVSFSIAFALFALQRLLLALTTQTVEDAAPLYIVRLLGFLVLIWAIVDKNRAAP